MTRDEYQAQRSHDRLMRHVYDAYTAHLYGLTEAYPPRCDVATHSQVVPCPNCATPLHVPCDRPLSGSPWREQHLEDADGPRRWDIRHYHEAYAYAHVWRMPDGEDVIIWLPSCAR